MDPLWEEHWQAGVKWFSNPLANPKLHQYLNDIDNLKISDDEKRMITWTIESIYMLGYTIYDFLYFYGMEGGEPNEEALIYYATPIVNIFLERPHDLPCVSEEYKHFLRFLDSNWLEIFQLSKYVPDGWNQK